MTPEKPKQREAARRPAAEQGPRCERCGAGLPVGLQRGWTSYLVLEATTLLLFAGLIVLEASFITVVVVLISVWYAWLLWFAFGPVRCPGCGKWQRARAS